MEHSLIIIAILISFTFSFQAVLGQTPSFENPVFDRYAGDLKSVKESVDKFQGKDDGNIVGDHATRWVLRAISPRNREKWMDFEMMNDSDKVYFNKELDALRKSIASRLPSYRLPAFNVRDSELEALMMGTLDDASRLTIHKIGIADEKWIKTSPNSLPFRKAYILATDSSDDHKYCHLYVIHLNQNYVGTGYGDPSASLRDDIIVSCSK